MMQVKLVYFAWVRERIGRSDEVRDVPADVETVSDVISWLSRQGTEYETAFADPAVIRAAIDREHVQLSSPISGAREIAFFPPVTGG